MTDLKIDKTLLNCVISGTTQALTMAHFAPEPCGASRFPAAPRELSVLVGLHGERNGTLTMNLTKGTAIWVAKRFLGQDEPIDLDEDGLDAMCEIGNIIAGRCKDLLLGSPFHFNSISIPAVVMGANYAVYYHRGIVSASVEFEIKEIPMTRMRDKFFSTAISFMRK